MNKKGGFTLVELIVVVTILAILGVISFITIQGYTQEARDSKRISDIRNLISKITIENTKGALYSNLIAYESNGGKVNTGLTILSKTGEWSNQGPANFLNLKEPRENFIDPLTGSDYIFGYTEGKSEDRAYSFVQGAGASEKYNNSIILGNYYQLIPEDEKGIIFPDGCNASDEGCEALENGGIDLPPVSSSSSGGGENSGSNVCKFGESQFGDCIFG